MTRRIISVLIGLALWLPGTPVAAELTHRLIATDDEPFDRFGVSVAISGGTAIVGGDQDDSFGGQEPGAVYLFDVATGDPVSKLMANDAGAIDRFGGAVGASNGIAIVGASLDDTAGRNTGSAYLFDMATGAELNKLTAADAVPFSRLGWSVAIDGGVAIASTRTDGNSDTFSGAAYLFDTATGRQLHKLTANNAQPAAEDFFGWSVAVGGNRALVGAIGDSNAGANAGAVYVFDVVTGDQVARLTADDAAPLDRFGTSVAISGNTVIVGSRSGANGGEFGGAVYLFDLTTGRQVAKLIADDATPLDRFGWSVAIDGNIAVVGSILGLGDDGSQTGAAYVFDVATGSQLAKLTGGRAVALGDTFGWSVGINGNTAIISSPDTKNETGLALLFDLADIIPEPTTFGLVVVGVAWMGVRTQRSGATDPKTLWL